jgi:WD40 repeat protein
MQLLESASPGERHEGEVFACACSADGAFVLTAGWDGQLRLWEAGSGSALASLPASPRPLSACAFSADGRQWVTGSMEGLLTFWDSVSHQTESSFLAHTRPVSAVTYSPSGTWLCTTSWDRNLALRKVGKEREARVLQGHQDIVAGCAFTTDGRQIVSWSHDRTLRLWDLDVSRDVHTFTGHGDRVTAASLSPDGRWLLSGSRDETARLWDLHGRAEVAAVKVGTEVRCCEFLLDAESVLIVDAAGRIFLMSIPGFEGKAQLQTGLKFLCSDLAPSGQQLALGGEDGRLHRLSLEGLTLGTLVVTATQSLKPASGLLNRLMGSTKLTRTFNYACPVCQNSFETTKLPAHPIKCPKCRQSLRVNPQTCVMVGC